MILVRKPLRVFDVDVVGLAVLAAVSAGGYLAAIVPARAQAKQRSVLAAQADAAQTQARRAEEQLRGVAELTEELHAAVESRIAESPTCSDINTIVNRMMVEAEDAGLQIASIEPQPPAPLGDHYVCDVTIEGNGREPDVVAFLGALSARLPYHSIESFSVTRGPNFSDGLCRVVLRARLHVLPDELKTPSEETP